MLRQVPGNGRPGGKHMGHDEEARLAKAKRLREQIRGILNADKAAAKRTKEAKAKRPKQGEGGPNESPRDFIHRRMRELAETEEKDHT